eukprot:m.335209 g.335209  ORF g.335209 m.335209 type:complete len:120 (-) comp27765_c4_seq1:1-360(-)
MDRLDRMPRAAVQYSAVQDRGLDQTIDIPRWASSNSASSSGSTALWAARRCRTTKTATATTATTATATIALELAAETASVDPAWCNRLAFPLDVLSAPLHFFGDGDDDDDDGVSTSAIS